MRSVTAAAVPTGVQRIVRAAIVAGAIAVGFVAVDQSIQRVDDRARGERLCLIEAMLAVKDALQGRDVPPDLPPACADLADRLHVPTSTVPPTTTAP